MKQTSRGLAPSLNTGHSTFTGARQRLAVALVAIVIAFAGAQTAWAKNTCNVTFVISSGGTVEVLGETVTNGETIDFIIPDGSDLIITPETGYYVSSVTYDATDGLLIDLFQLDDFHWSLDILPYEGSETPTITVRIVFDKGLAGGADEASAVALTADNDLSHLTGGWYKVESDLTLGHTVNLHGDTHITIATGKTLTVSTSGEYGISGSALTVSGEGTLNVSANQSAISVDNYTQMGCDVTLSGDTYGLHATNDVSISGGSLTTSGASYGIDTNYGSITISGGTVSSSGKRCGLYACDALSITGGTVSASGNNYGIIGLSVSITGGQVTVSSGGIRSIYGDITLGWTSATDYITASGFTVEEGFYVKIADGQKLYGGGFPSASYNGTIGDPSALNGKTLRPTAAVTESGTNEYTIRYADGWDAFCDRLAADDGKDFFSGKTVKLGADITVSRMAGSGAAEDLTANDRPFCGTFDGGGNKLTFKYGSADSPADENNIAPFRYVNNATIQHLHVDGDIYTRHTHAGGIVGQAYGTTNITDCRSSVNIISSITGDGTHGGIMSCSWTGSTTSITGCLFDGSIQSASGYTTNQCGGFVGWRNATINVSNSLLTADLSTIDTPDGLTNPSATFVRNGNNNTITNCYYTQPFGTAQGKQTHTVTAGTDVTVAHAGVATHYATSGITAYKATGASADSDPFIAGIIYNNVLYAGSGDEVSLTLTNRATPTGDAPLGYKNGDYSATGGATLSGSTLTMADDNVTVSFTPGDQLRSTGQAVLVSYVDAGGTARTAQAIALDGTATDLGTDDEETWYFVGLPTVAFDHMLNLHGDVHLILADGCTMNVTSDADGIEVNGSLTIYGQTDGTGTLNATSDYGAGIFTNGGTITISGGRVTVTGGNEAGIYTSIGYLTIRGGRVTVNSRNGVGITTNSGTITLGCTTASDFIYASSYFVGSKGRLNIASGQTLYDEDGNPYSGNGVTIPDGKTLRPLPNVLALDDAADNSAAITANDRETRNVILYGRTLYKDGAWNTLCLPFALGDDQAPSGHELDGTPLEGATLMTLGNSQACNTGFDTQTGTLNLEFLPAKTVEPGVAYIVKWPIPDGMTAEQFAAAYAANPDAYDLKNPVFTGVTVTNDAPADHATTSLDGYVTFIGTYGPADIYADPATALYLGAANKLYWPTATDFELKPFRAYFQLKNGLTAGTPSSPKAVRAFSLNFGDSSESTGIVEITDPTPGPSPAWEGSAAGWYSMDGRKLQAQPTKSGLYIHGGKKVVVP